MLCGYRLGDEEEGFHKKKKGPTEPVSEYEVTVKPQQSVEDLYQQYHLLIVTSLKEASDSINKDYHRACGMIKNAYHYLQILSELYIDEHKDDLREMKTQIKEIYSSLERSNLTQIKKSKIERRLKDIVAVLKTDYKYEKIAEWTKE